MVRDFFLLSWPQASPLISLTLIEQRKASILGKIACSQRNKSTHIRNPWTLTIAVCVSKALNVYPFHAAMGPPKDSSWLQSVPRIKSCSRREVMPVVIIMKTLGRTNKHQQQSLMLLTFWLINDQLGWVKGCQSYFWVCLWRCFWKRLTFESTDWVEKIHPH